MSRMSADMRSFRNCSSTLLASWVSAPVNVALGLAGAGVACEMASAGELACSVAGIVSLVVSVSFGLVGVAGALFAGGFAG